MTETTEFMIEAIGISSRCLEHLDITSTADQPWFQWRLPDLNRISLLNTEIEDCRKEIQRWSETATRRELTPILLLTKSEADHLQGVLPPSIEIDPLPEGDDPLFDRISHDMCSRLYTPDPWLTRRWINWKRLGILPPKGAANAYPEAIWSAYGKGLHDWFDANQKTRHPIAARSLIFSRQKPVQIGLLEVDLDTKERDGEHAVTFSPMDMPFARFRLERSEGDAYRLRGVFGPIGDQELEAPSLELIDGLQQKSLKERVRELIQRLFSYDPSELVPSYGASNATSDEDAFEIGEQHGIQASIGWQGERSAPFFEITLEMDGARINQYLPALGRQDEPFVLSVSTRNQEGESRDFVFELVVSTHKKGIYFAKEAPSHETRAGEYYQQAGDLTLYLQLPLRRGTLRAGEHNHALQLTVTFESSAESVTFPFD